MLGLRLIIGFGILLIVLAGGGAAWQVWHGQQNAGAEAPEAVQEHAKASVPETGSDLPPGPLQQLAAFPPKPLARPGQSWLISEGGALLERDEALAWIGQDRFIASRKLTITLRQPLNALLSPGEKLPDPAYHQVFADIRAPMIGKDLCRILAESLADGCRLVVAHAQKDSVNTERGTAIFNLEFVYTVKGAELPQPDLGSHVALVERFRIGEGKGEEPLPTTDLDVWLRAALERAVASCAPDGRHDTTCRITGAYLSWMGPDSENRASAQRTRLAPLPVGMYPAPPLDEGGAG